MGVGWEALAAFVERLEMLESPQALAAATVGVSEGFGLGTVMCGAILSARDAVEAKFYFGNWPPEWQVAYPEKVLADDPLVAEARRRIDPFTWSELKAGGGLSVAMHQAFAFTHANGWLDGFAVPIHGPGGYVALVSFAGGQIGLLPRDRALLTTLARAAHDRGRLICRETSEGAPKLTLREAQVMRWIAHGKTDWEVGQILGVSHTTVHFHVEKVKRKLDCRSRAQLIGRLHLGGLI